MAEENAITPDDEAATPAEQTPGDDETTQATSSSGVTARQAADALPPKERRRRSRAAKAAAVSTRPQTAPEERQAERDAERRRKARIRSGRRTREREKARAARGTTPAAEPLAPRREQHPGQQKTRQGIVVSDRASKTIVVRIDVARRHRSYGKVVRTSTTLRAHDEREDAHIGDTVVVRESRPLSRTKRWRLVEVVERAR
jgi:small subunit ribosomal protein S17